MKTTICILLLIIASALMFTSISCKQNIPKPAYNFYIRDTLPEGNGETVKVVILSGQSNAAGCSLFSYLENEPDFNKLSAGYENIYLNFYEAAVERSTDGFFPVTGQYGYDDAYFGPELGLADSLSSKYPEEKIFILKFTYSGAALDQTMAPGKSAFYSKMISFIGDSMLYLDEKNYNPQLVGFCWMQGESDAMCAPDRYKYNMASLVTTLRSDLSESLGIFDAAIFDYPNLWVKPEVVNAAKQSLAEEMSDYYFLDTNAEGFTTLNEPEGNPDIAHYDAHYELELGRMFGNAIYNSLNKD